MTQSLHGATPSMRVTASAIDVHLWSRPFDPAEFDPRVHFLLSAPAYQKTRAAEKAIDLGGLILFPLTKEEVARNRNHFWFRYANVVEKMKTQPATPLSDSREFLWPMRCRPKGLKLQFNASQISVPLKAHATIWLWPFGWSSTIELKSGLPFNLDNLQKFVGELREKSTARFSLDGKQLSLSGVFAHLRRLIGQHVGASGIAPSDVTKLDRYFLVSAEMPSGDAAPTRFSDWAPSDKLRMLSILRGRPVELPEFVNGGALFTPFGGSSLSVTDFDHGTLLLLQHWKDRRPTATRETNHCLNANLRAFLAVHFALHRFIVHSSRFIGDPNEQSNLAYAVSRAKSMLSWLPEEYRNALCAEFRSHYSPTT